ncbi:hypothetical protein PTKIN_Ptkin05aG0011800 [Pterospermum kingtungense]
METQACFSKTLTSDDPSPSESFVSRENLDGFSHISDSVAGSSSASSSVSPMTVDSPERETVANNPLSSRPHSTNDVFSLTSSSTESESSKSLAMVTSDFKKAFSCHRKDDDDDLEEDTYRWPFIPYGNPYDPYYSRRFRKYDHFYGGRGHEFRRRQYGYPPWTPGPPMHFSRPKEASRTVDEPTGLGAGLENLGNTCFINAVLQCFTHTVPFVLGLRSLNDHEKPCDRDIESFCLLCALRDHIELSLNSSGGVVSPSKIFDNLKYISSCFKRYEQEDAHEFLQCLLDRLESCCSDSKTKNDSSSPDDCLVKKVFGGRLVSRLCCCNCSHISYTYEPLNDLSLEIEDVDSLPSALESFTKVEKIEDPEATFRCENCKEEVSIEKQLMLDHAPSVATFHLKRFKTKGTDVEKIVKHVAFPLELDLQPYTIVNESTTEELKYQLYAVVKHSGFRPTCGHYVCYIRSSPNTWHILSDSRVITVEEEDVLSQEAYILFYARQDIPWFSNAIEVQKPCVNPGISDSSPKSVLDKIECAGNPQVENRTDNDASESKDVADKTSTQFSWETLFEAEDDEQCVDAERMSEAPANESELQVSKSMDSRDDNPMIDTSLPPGSSNCSDELDKIVSAVSHTGEDNQNHGVDEATNESSFSGKPSRHQSPDKCRRDSSGCGSRNHLKQEKRGIHQRTGNRSSSTDQGRIEAMRYAKRMPISRGARIVALLTGQNSGKMKKGTRSSPCKRVSPRRRQNHNLSRPVHVSR